MKENDKCPNCGYTLKFKAGGDALYCEACLSEFPLSSKTTDLESKEMDFDDVVKMFNEHSNDTTIATMHCTECGASIEFDENRVSVTCPFCGSNKTVNENIKGAAIPIAGVVPFKFDEKEAGEVFKKWISKRMFAPNAFKRAVLLPKFYPLYVPYYTFDADTRAHYQGRRGTYYYETVRRRDAQGNVYTEEVRKIRWTSVSGNVAYDFDDVLAVASNNEKINSHIYRVSNFSLDESFDFDNKYVLGYYAQTPNVSPSEGLSDAKDQMESHLTEMAEDEIGGDESEVDFIDVSYSNVKCKQVMLPIYNGMYKYRGRTFYFTLNGQTKLFSGDRPYSPVKITFFVLFIVAIIAAIVILVGMFAK